VSGYTVSVFLDHNSTATYHLDAETWILHRMAYAETYLAIARIVHRFQLELHDTTSQDISIHHVRLVGYPKREAGASETYGEVKVRVISKLRN